jgi:pimeloyl-ACP methyl ester carboxylesterase
MSGPMFRTRFRQQIVAEFLPPSRERTTQKVVILCDGMSSIPRKQSLSEFLPAKGFWVIYPRYRGAWESDGRFLEKSPPEDNLNIIDDLPEEIEEIAFGRRFRLSPDQIFVIAGSFGGAAAILLSLDPRVQRVVANCRPRISWYTTWRNTETGFARLGVRRPLIRKIVNTLRAKGQPVKPGPNRNLSPDPDDNHICDCGSTEIPTSPSR